MGINLFVAITMQRFEIEILILNNEISNWDGTCDMMLDGNFEHNENMDNLITTNCNFF